MNLDSLNLKYILGITYLVIISTGLYFLFSVIDIKDLTSYEFIRQNKDVILKHKSENFLLLTALFFVFSVVWVLLLGFAMPLLLLAGFIFGKWWGITIVLISTTIGATFCNHDTYSLQSLVDWLARRSNKSYLSAANACAIGPTGAFTPDRAIPKSVFPSQAARTFMSSLE